VNRMSEEQKQKLQHYLTGAREAVTWKAEGLSEYDARLAAPLGGRRALG